MISIINRNSNAHLYTNKCGTITPLIHQHTTSVEIENSESIGYTQLHRITEEDNLRNYDLIVMGIEDKPYNWNGFHTFKDLDNTFDISENTLQNFYEGLLSTSKKVDTIVMTTNMLLWLRELKDDNGESLFEFTQETNGKYYTNYINGIKYVFVSHESKVAIAGLFTQSLSYYEYLSTGVERTRTHKTYSYSSMAGYYYLPEHFVKFVA